MLYKNSYSNIVIIIMAFSLFGCASMSPKPLQLTDMVPRNPELTFRSSGKSISIGEIQGRQEKGDAFYRITTSELRQIVVDGLKHTQLFSSVYVINQKNADYTLTAKILGQPFVGGWSPTVALYVKYRIKRNDNGATVFDKRIQSVYTATAGGVFKGIERIRKANEGAARENIKKLIEELSKIQI